MQKRTPIALLATLLVLAACTTRDRNTPRETIATITTALNDRDSATFINSMSKTVRDRFANNPAGLSAILDSVQGSRVSSDVVSVDESKVTPNVAQVVFNVHVRGKIRRDADHIVAEFDKEDDGWKLGPIWSIAGQPFGRR